MKYTASTAFFEALWDAGVTHCFVNLGSDHPSILEAIARNSKNLNGRFPRIITCPHEVCLPPDTEQAVPTHPTLIDGGSVNG